MPVKYVLRPYFSLTPRDDRFLVECDDLKLVVEIEMHLAGSAGA